MVICHRYRGDRFWLMTSIRRYSAKVAIETIGPTMHQRSSSMTRKRASRLICRTTGISGPEAIGPFTCSLPPETFF